MVKRNRIEKLEKEIAEVKKLAIEFKKRNGNASVSIPNKDILLLLLTKSSDADKRIARVEGVLKILIPMVLAGIGISISGLI